VRFPWPHVPDAVRWHHERSDGSGYPDSLHNSEIPLQVRIIAVADTFDAMTSERPYREPHSLIEAAHELVRLTPAKFDSSVVQALLVQLRLDAEGRSPAPMLTKAVGAKLSVLELDHLSVDLVRRLTGNRVYSA
jgi:HD-GYP domain-containing protein (c-di-GMP phosphodiesterase class II)